MIERESRGCERSFLNTYYSWFTERRYIDFIQQIQYYTGTELVQWRMLLCNTYMTRYDLCQPKMRENGLCGMKYTVMED